MPLDKLSHQTFHIPPDGAFLSSSNLSPRAFSQLTRQYDLPHFSPQGNGYALDSGHAYPPDIPAPRVLPPTVDPSSLLHRQISVPNVQAESISESEVEMDDEGESDRGWEPQYDDDDGGGWARHPATIGLGHPGFGGTETKGNLRDAAGAQVLVAIHARWVLKKKAAKQEKCWILYRRNYFGIQASYTLNPVPDSSPDETLYLCRDNHAPEPIKTLSMCMRGIIGEKERAEIKIVVFNAKRKPLHVGRNPPPIEPQKMKPLAEGSTKFYVKSTGDRRDNMNVPMNHTFHRNQFKAATQNNGARRADQQFYHILLELKAEILVDGVPKLFTVASKISDALVVRGRCPLSFKGKDGRTQGPDNKGRKPPRDRGGNGSKRRLGKQSQKEGRTKKASRASGNMAGASCRRSTRASSHLPTLTYGTGSPSTDTAPVSPLPTSRAIGTINSETITELDRKLIEETRGSIRHGIEGDPMMVFLSKVRSI